MASTIKQVAKVANVSIATVSRALSDDVKVKSETKKLVLDAARDLNYKPNILARNFVKGKSNIVGLILPDISDEFFSEIIRGVDETSYVHGYYTLVISSHKNRSLVESVHTLMGAGLVGGFIVLVPFMDRKIKEALMHERVPFVIISGSTEIDDYNSVSVDNYKAAYELTEYLITKKGCKKFAHITGPLENNDALLRMEGFLDACLKHNINVLKSWIVKGNFTKEGGIEATKKLLELKNKPEVIFAANDWTAVGCYEVIFEKGLKIPRDIAVVGFDDVMISRHLHPPLTTVKVPTSELGQTAANVLINKIHDRNHSAAQSIKIATELVIRKSC